MDVVVLLNLSNGGWKGHITGSNVKIGYEDRAGEKRRMVADTTLLGPVAHPAEDILTLYVKRWDIELRFCERIISRYWGTRWWKNIDQE